MAKSTDTEFKLPPMEVIEKYGMEELSKLGGCIFIEHLNGQIQKYNFLTKVLEDCTKRNKKIDLDTRHINSLICKEKHLKVLSHEFWFGIVPSDISNEKSLDMLDAYELFIHALDDYLDIVLNVSGDEHKKQYELFMNKISEEE